MEGIHTTLPSLCDTAPTPRRVSACHPPHNNEDPLEKQGLVTSKAALYGNHESCYTAHAPYNSR